MLLVKFEIAIVYLLIFTGYFAFGQITTSACDSTKQTFLCGNGNCIDSSRRCNTQNDCGDNSDEQNCTCDSLHYNYPCDNGGCVTYNQRCNSIPDCSDGSDELKCCEFQNKYQCPNSSQCIYFSNICNNVSDCSDGSEEAGCSTYPKPLRLIGGNDTYGRLQIQIGSVWATVCDDSWNQRSSRLACQQLGFLYGTINYNNFNILTGKDVPIGLDDVQCNGTEKYITECYHRPYFQHNCGHSQDVFLICFNSCKLQNKYQCPNSTQCISFSNICNNVSDCPDGSDEIGCSTYPKPLRLVGGSETYGRLQIQIGSVWATVCDNSGNPFISSLVCKQLGYRYGNMDYNNSNISAGNDVPIGLDDVQCNGTERYITECYHKPYFQNYCSHSEDVFIFCYNACESTKQRFLCRNDNCIDSSRRCNTQNDCEDNSDEQNCTCDSLYYNYPCAKGGCVSYNQRCNSIPDCSDGSDELKCCEFKKKYQCPDSTECIYFSNICNNVSDCNDGSDEVECSTYPKPLRLVGGNESYGRLQIQIGSVWATVCNDYWDQLSSRIACQQLGFRYGTLNFYNYISTANDVPIGLDDVRCTGNERYITECYHRPYFQHDCSHNEDVFLTCYNSCESTNQSFLCGNGNCIDSTRRCNTQNDCGDNSDELDCTCDSSYYIYPCGNGACVSYNQRCDSIPDCSD